MPLAFQWTLPSHTAPKCTPKLHKRQPGDRDPHAELACAVRRQIDCRSDRAVAAHFTADRANKCPSSVPARSGTVQFAACIRHAHRHTNTHRHRFTHMLLGELFHACRRRFVTCLFVCEMKIRLCFEPYTPVRSISLMGSPPVARTRPPRCSFVRLMLCHGISFFLLLLLFASRFAAKGDVHHTAGCTRAFRVWLLGNFCNFIESRFHCLRFRKGRLGVSILVSDRISAVPAVQPNRSQI